MTTPRPLLLLPLLAIGCSTPGFVATKTIDLTLPAASLRELQCDSHNGSITVKGEGGRTEIGLHAEFSVRGYTQQEADDNLTLLELGRDETAGSLHLYGRHPEGTLDNRSPTCSFSLVVPDRLAVVLGSHNGDLVVRGTQGDAKLETHNGDIDGSLTSSRIEATSHNGRVQLHIAGDARLDGTISTHNGDVELTLDDGLSTTVEASTHNGRIRACDRLQDTRARSGSLTGRFGAGDGRLTVESHNGDVVIR